MAISGFDPTNPHWQLESVRKDLRLQEEKVHQLEESIKRVTSNLDQKDKELDELKNERGDLRLKLGLANGELKHIRENKASKRRAFYAALLLALASMSAGWGINLLTSTSPNLVGFFLLGGAVILYAIGAHLTTLLA
jgi:septal ring factor EnvC (AmiA/AmiB activator)